MSGAVAVRYFVWRRVNANRWTPEVGYDDPQAAERAARFYRADRKRRVVVVPTPTDTPRERWIDCLRATLEV